MAHRVAIYGGSFNPPHVGHVLNAVWALSIGAVDEVLVVPCFVHPFAKELAPFADRFAMCAAAMRVVPNATVSRVEEELGGESRTLRTLEHLAGLHPDWSMRLLIGADILADTPKWHGFDRVVAIAPLLVVGRAGVHADVPPPELPEVSSTGVRDAIARGAFSEIERVVPAAVRHYVEARGLYQRGGDE